MCRFCLGLKSLVYSKFKQNLATNVVDFELRDICGCSWNLKMWIKDPT